VECAFCTHTGADKYESAEKEHGRIEIRHSSILQTKDYLVE
jgi:hypothetical protein